MIFRKDNEYGTSYSVGLSKKNKDGSYTNGYMPIQFKKDVELNNQDKIFIKNAFLTFYISKDKKTVPYIMCLEYEEAKFDKPKTDAEVLQEAVNTPDEEIDFNITDEDLPF
jgi:hypothetical protein